MCDCFEGREVPGCCPDGETYPEEEYPCEEEDYPEEEEDYPEGEEDDTEEEY